MVYSALYEFCETLLMVSCFSKFNRFLHSSFEGSKQYTPKGKTRKYEEKTFEILINSCYQTKLVCIIYRLKEK